MARKYTPEQAEKWGWEELVACILSPASYIFVSLGLALVILLIPMGWVYLIIGLISTALMYLVIDPKLRAISDEYERNQAEFLKHVEAFPNGRMSNERTECLVEFHPVRGRKTDRDESGLYRLVHGPRLCLV